MYEMSTEVAAGGVISGGEGKDEGKGRVVRKKGRRAPRASRGARKAWGFKGSLRAERL